MVNRGQNESVLSSMAHTAGILMMGHKRLETAQKELGKNKIVSLSNQVCCAVRMKISRDSTLLSLQFYNFFFFINAYVFNQR